MDGGDFRDMAQQAATVPAFAKDLHAVGTIGGWLDGIRSDCQCVRKLYVFDHGRQDGDHVSDYKQEYGDVFLGPGKLSTACPYLCPDTTIMMMGCYVGFNTELKAEIREETCNDRTVGAWACRGDPTGTDARIGRLRWGCCSLGSRCRNKSSTSETYYFGGDGCGMTKETPKRTLRSSVFRRLRLALGVPILLAVLWAVTVRFAGGRLMCWWAARWDSAFLVHVNTVKDAERR